MLIILLEEQMDTSSEIFLMYALEMITANSARMIFEGVKAKEQSTISLTKEFWNMNVSAKWS